MNFMEEFLGSLDREEQTPKVYSFILNQDFCLTKKLKVQYPNTTNNQEFRRVQSIDEEFPHLNSYGKLSDIFYMYRPAEIKKLIIHYNDGANRTCFSIDLRRNIALQYNPRTNQPEYISVNNLNLPCAIDIQTALEALELTKLPRQIAVACLGQNVANDTLGFIKFNFKTRELTEAEKNIPDIQEQYKLYCSADNYYNLPRRFIIMQEQEDKYTEIVEGDLLFKYTMDLSAIALDTNGRVFSAGSMENILSRIERYYEGDNPKPLYRLIDGETITPIKPFMRMSVQRSVTITPALTEHEILRFTVNHESNLCLEDPYAIHCGAKYPADNLVIDTEDTFPYRTSNKDDQYKLQPADHHSWFITKLQSSLQQMKIVDTSITRKRTYAEVTDPNNAEKRSVYVVSDTQDPNKLICDLETVAGTDMPITYVFSSRQELAKILRRNPDAVVRYQELTNEYPSLAYSGG